ncbi:MAG: twin-arginine translocation signal domain-containing protein, partial [Pseudomonadota bacterium]
MANLNRRQFLGRSTAFGFAASLGAMTSLGAQRAWAADTSGYKAMVCLFLKGGMDHADTVIPYDQISYNQLRTIREG